MFKTLSGLTDDAFWGVPHQKGCWRNLVPDDTCGSPQNCRLLAVYVSLLANKWVLYQILSLISSIF
jgi:hypothetical protein